MHLIKQQGGYAIAVYQPDNSARQATAEKLITEDRVNFACPADYSENSEIYQVVTTIIDKMKADAALEKLEK
jgi:hypothetical protein